MSDLSVVYDGPRFAAVDKPAGWLSVPGRTGVADARPVLGLRLQERLGTRLWPVHRLDAEVSGLVLFAKDAEAHRVASAWFEGHSVKKVYEALTEPSDKPMKPGERCEWRDRLLRGKKRAYESPHGKDAVTAAELVGSEGGLWRWRLEPLTGRPHQLRVHLATYAAPIAGDTLYGSQVPWPHGGIALRAVRLELGACAGRGELQLPERLEVPGLSAGEAHAR